jgi:dynein heavy chain
MEMCQVLSAHHIVQLNCYTSSIACRDRFDAFIKRLANMSMVDGDRVSATQLPAKSLYEYCFDTSEGCWKA